MCWRLEGDLGLPGEREHGLVDLLPPFSTGPEPVRGDDEQTLDLAGLIHFGRAKASSYYMSLKKREKLRYFLCKNDIFGSFIPSLKHRP